VPKEEGQCIVFVNDMKVMTLDEEEFEIYHEMEEAIQRVADAIQAEFDQLTQEEQVEVAKQMTEQYIKAMKLKD
jgi:hypothetical protein